MRMGSRGRLPAAVAAGMAVLALASLSFANVYPAKISINSATFDTTTGTAKIGYVLNENADGDGVNPGVKIEVLDAGSNAVRTVTIFRQLRGKYTFEWDGRNDAGNRVANGSYTVKITASDYGYTAWTQIVPDQVSTNFERPFGVAVNKHVWSPNYGRIYVSQTRVSNTVAGRAMLDGIYVVDPDASDAGFSTGGVDWTDASNVSPWKSNIGPDDHLYVCKYDVDLAYEFSADLSVATQLIDASNKNSGQYVESIWVEGTQAGGDRKIYLTNARYLNTRVGLIEYTLGANATATPGDLGVQFIGPSYYTYYPRDFARDSNGDWYCCQYRATPGQAPVLSKFANGTPPINTAVWEASNQYIYAYGIDIYEPKGIIAYGQANNGFVHVFEMATGAYVASFDAGSALRDVAFDAVGNLYTVDNVTERLRIWSPPDGPNSNSTTTAAIALNKSGSGGPVIGTHPMDVAVCPGDNASFTVAATGGTLSYQWKKNDQNVGTNSPNLQLTAVTAADDGAIITCVITDANGVAVSDPAVLTVGIAFLQVPLSATVCQNSNAQFTASVGVPGATYQWQRTVPPDTTFVDIGGQTSPTLTLAVTGADNGTQVRVRATAGACGSADSPAATITVSAGPTLGLVATSYVTPNPRPSGSGATFYATIVNATGPVSYQWYREGEALVNGTYPWGVVSEATGANLVLSELGCLASGRFTVGITDNCGTTISTCTAAPGTAGQTCYLTVGAGIETCNNGVDDDCDGMVDCEDSDCSADPFCGPSCHEPFADWDEDGDVDMLDFADFQRCYTTTGAIPDGCECFDYNSDGFINTDDATSFIACGSGPGIPADPACDDRPSGLGKVVLNEVVYNVVNTAGAEVSDLIEFVELYNKSPDTIDISGWILKASDIAADDNRDFQVPGGVGSGTTLLAPGGYYLFTSPNVPVPLPNPPTLDYTIVPNPTDIWENGPDVLELLDANKNPVDTLIYYRALGAVAATGEGAVWGNLYTIDNTAPMSVSRWLDGLDTNDNGRDFGTRPWTPGASNLGTASVVPSFALTGIDALAPGAAVASLDGSFQAARVIDPTDAATTVDSYVINPGAIAASPQGGKAVVVWDYAVGGGSAAFSRNIMQNSGGFDLWVYIDTSFTAWGADTGRETTSFGVMGTTEPGYNTPDPEGVIFGQGAETANGNTGLCWIYNKIKTATGTSAKLYLVDAGHGGTSAPPNSQWVVHSNIDMSVKQSGWYRLSISYNGTNGSVTAVGPDGSVQFSTATGLTGGFYVGYRETTGTTAAPTPAYLRPATFDSAQ